MEIYTLYSKIYYDNNEYKKLIVLDRKPTYNSLINNIIKQIDNTKLSPFDIQDYKCIYAILNPYNSTKLLEIQEITLLFSWLVNNDYKINTKFTEIIQNSNLKIKNNIICFISNN